MNRAHPDTETVRARFDSLQEHIGETLAEIKPKLRGWIHLTSTPLVLAAGIVLIALSPTGETKAANAIYSATALLLFGISALYHRGRWSPRVWRVLNTFDHSNIYVFIAGSYTPFAVILLDGTAQTVMLSVVWTGAILGVIFKVFLPKAPRVLSAPIYIALGWAAVFFIPGFYSGATDLGFGVGVAIFVLICAGGLLYTLGGLVYGFKWPDPSPRWFGFHEIFHGFTIAAFTVHYVGVSLATYALR